MKTTGTERWLPVVGQPFYEVSDHGRVRSIDRVITDKNGKIKSLLGRFIKPSLSRSAGYEQVICYANAKPKMKRIHRMVADAFLVPNGDRPVVNHKDGNTRNNGVANLEWCTLGENLTHSYSLGRREHPIPARPVVMGGVKYPTVTHAAKANGTHAGVILRALNRNHKFHGMAVLHG